jgi:very-short-patch-repair endonuclease
MNERLLKFAKSMRHQPTDAEAALWKHLRAGRFSGFKFKRQQPVGHYIVDYVCLERRVVVEVDGGQHDAGLDGKRTQWLEAQSFRILRFWNDEVLKREKTC